MTKCLGILLNLGISSPIVRDALCQAVAYSSTLNDDVQTSSNDTTPSCEASVG